MDVAVHLKDVDLTLRSLWVAAFCTGTLIPSDTLDQRLFFSKIRILPTSTSAQVYDELAHDWDYKWEHRLGTHTGTLNLPLSTFKTPLSMRSFIGAAPVGSFCKASIFVQLYIDS